MTVARILILFLFVMFHPGSQAYAEPKKGAEALLAHSNETWKGDLDGILKRGFIRILTVNNPLYFGFDGKEVRGLAIEIGREFEKHLRKTIGKRARNLNVVFVPVARDKLLSGLVSGRGDIAAANLTITKARQALVDFSNPMYPNVSELIVTGPGAQGVSTFDDLVRVPIHVRTSSSYFGHLVRLNKQRKKAGKKLLSTVAADERLEDYDLLEMLNAGHIKALIVDSHKLELWQQVFKKIKVHKNLSVNSGGKTAWAFRKNSPQLRSAVNGFVKKMRKGTLLGNVLLTKYVKTTDWIDNVRGPKARKLFEKTAKYLKQYSKKYNFDWLMIAAQGYQESKLDQRKRSKAGAVGIMQIMPKTARDKNVNIRAIHIAESNVHAGVKYLRLLQDRYFNDAEISNLDRVLFSFAAYNAGPGAIRRARKRAKSMGFDPNIWFGNVEVAAARSISREPVIYVRNIYKYYVMYKELNLTRREKAKLK